MGDSDRLKKHISDYIEQNLDPATKDQLEQQMDRDPDLKRITGNVAKIPSLLKGLSPLKTSEDFNVRLREKIHTEPQRGLWAFDVKRVSYAFSFIVLIAAIIVTVTNLQEKSELPDNQNLQTVSPVSSTPAVSRSSLTNDEMSVKTKEEQAGLKDSLETKKKPGFKYVDQEK